MTKTTKNVFQSSLSLVTMLAFAFMPFAYGGLDTAVAQEAPECSPMSDVVVSDIQTDVDDGETVAVATIPEQWTSIDGATWIWNDAQVEEGADPGTLVFTRTFNWESDATTTAELEIATDNTYSVTVNTEDAGASADPDNFSSSDLIDISEHIVNGANTVEFTVTNLGDEPNPAGLLYRIDLDGFECDEEAVTPSGEIISPTEDETVSGTTTLEAVYNDGDGELDNDVQWAVREGACEVGTTTVFGNVDGHNDPFDWDGASFLADIDTTTVADGEYCFIFNPTDDGETDVRETVTFNILNNEGGDEPVATTTITVHKVIVNDDGGTATTSDFVLLVGDMEVESGVAEPVEPGVHVVSEFGTSTVNYEASFSGDCDALGEVSIDEGEHLECTITNDDIAPVEQCVAFEETVVSDSETMVNGTSSVAVDIDPETEGNQIPEAWTADIDGATWIWSDAQNDGTAATGTEVLSRSFEWSSDATSTAVLNIASDNTYSVEINGTEVASSTDEDNYSSADQYDVSDFITNGTNTIEISVTNVPLDGDGNNPAGLLYSLELEGFECEEPDEPVDDDDEEEESSGGGGGGVINRNGDDDDDDGDDDGEVAGARTGQVIETGSDEEEEEEDEENRFFRTLPGSVLGTTAFPGFPNTGAGGGADDSVVNTITLILLGGGIITILLVLSQSRLRKKEISSQ